MLKMLFISVLSVLVLSGVEGNIHTKAVRVNTLNIANPLDCQVCMNALQIELGKGNDNFIEFANNAPHSCAAATNIDDQKVVCAVTLIKNSKQLFKDQKNNVPAMTSCINIGCVAPTTSPTPTKAPTTAPPTKAPTTTPPTKSPTTAPPTKSPPTEFEE